ncbi:MAG TPA: tetratricopeptide repeat protein [Bacteroidia bacterium]|nr:tetratricopeptide repeat protein [Bacteroidia bacterium]
MKFPNLLLFLILICGCQSAIGQNRAMDSMHNALKTEQDDTNKVNTLNLLSGKLRGIAKYDTALACASEAAALAERLGFKKGMTAAYRNLGITYDYQGNYPKALDYDNKALQINQEIGNKEGVARNLRNIGNVYDDQANYPKALEYDMKSLAIDQEIGNKSGIAADLGNIGIAYNDEGNYPKALEYDLKSLAIDKEMGTKDGIAADLGNIAIIYAAEGNYPKTLEYDYMALALNKEIGRKMGIGFNLNSIGSIYTKQKNYKRALAVLDSSLDLAKNIGEKNLIKNAYAEIATLDSAMGNYKTALQDYKSAIVYRDSLINEANIKADMNFEFAQKEAAKKAEQDKKDALTQADERKQRIIIWSVEGGLILVLVFAAFVFRSLRITRRQKLDIESKSKVIEEKNKDILDSIMYAKRLQDAILPPLSLIKEHLPESFVLYKPKDIVAGDFYWMEVAPLNSPEGGTLLSKSPPSEGGEAVLIAAADCTGHGVPGALVSVVCSNALNRTVKEFKITEPGKILDKVRELVLETFEKSESNVQDGMDVSLASITPSEGGIQVQWSGAYNTLWYIENGVMKEISADKQPIGKTDNPKPFTTHTITLNPPSEDREAVSLYLFTDGYADQFGGPKGKKFKYKQLQEKLLAISRQSMEEQKKILEQTLEDWKGDLEQVDDILIIGIRV